ncbi:MAG: TIGR04283 family arsenosugar biosynthesis glycosyltransferase [Balneolaceae bacterium]
MISIIIPTFNEEENIERVLEFLNSHSKSYECEILVVDGGSSDSTIKVAKALGARVFNSPEKGRAKQMNFGAENAAGEVLYFLHADTIPPPDFLQEISQKITQGFDSGCFRLSFDNPHPMLKFYSWFTRFDVLIFRFGDQSLYTKKALFQNAGGFDENLLVMEDQEIIRRLKHHSQFSLIKKAVVTSARKYDQLGVFKLQYIFTIITLLYYIGVSQKVLVDFYTKACAGNQY